MQTEQNRNEEQHVVLCFGLFLTSLHFCIIRRQRQCNNRTTIPLVSAIFFWNPSLVFDCLDWLSQSLTALTHSLTHLLVVTVTTTTTTRRASCNNRTLEKERRKKKTDSAQLHEKQIPDPRHQRQQRPIKRQHSTGRQQSTVKESEPQRKIGQFPILCSQTDTITTTNATVNNSSKAVLSPSH